MNDEARLEKLLKIYHPNVPNGNFLGDAQKRGENEGIKKAIVALELASPEKVDRLFRERDTADWAESEARMRRMDERRAQAQETPATYHQLDGTSVHDGDWA